METLARSHESNLSDRELFLLDFLFDAIAPRAMIDDENFPIHNNTPYSHGFNTRELDAVLIKFSNEDVLFSEQHNHHGKQTQYFGLTAKGGELWESERKPSWGRYIDDSQELSKEEGIWKAKIRAFSPEILTESSAYYAESGFLGIPVSELEYAQVISSLVYWKEPFTVYECTYLAREDECPKKTNWAEYEKNRKWWRNVRELQKCLA